MTDLPILWSFRRCPYAMRARLAVQSAGIPVELREILLKDKPQAFLDTSPSATVPALDAGDTILDESLDIMIWVLNLRDPAGLMNMPEEGWALIAECDGPFKTALDHTKYAVRYPDRNAKDDRETAAGFLRKLDGDLAKHPWLFGDRPTIADLAILPFVRQFANTDRAWFDAQDWAALIRWLDGFLASPDFQSIMGKYPPWSDGDTPVVFPN